jgi:dihydroorotase
MINSQPKEQDQLARYYATCNHGPPLHILPLVGCNNLQQALPTLPSAKHSNVIPDGTDCGQHSSNERESAILPAAGFHQDIVNIIIAQKTYLKASFIKKYSCYYCECTRISNYCRNKNY